MKTILIALLALGLVAGGYYWYSNMEVRETPEAEVMNEEEEMESEAKLDINAVCEGALAYMTFPDGESAEVFVKECKEGQHPEVIERYKADMGLDANAAI